MNRTHLGILFAANAMLLTAACTFFACSSQPQHGAPVGDCPEDAHCLGFGGNPGGTLPPDGGGVVDAGDVGEAGVVNITAGEVRNIASFTQAPGSGTLDTEASLFVKGAKGAAFAETAVVGGDFALAGLDNTSVNFAYLESRATTPIVTRTVYGFPVDRVGGAYTIQIPSFPDNLSQTLALSLGVPLTSGSTRGTATVVVQVVDESGLAVKGVLGDGSAFAPRAPGSTANPYYDDNSDGLVASATGTGTRGTIVWLAAVPGYLPVTIHRGTTTYPTFNAPTTADAVTFIRLAIAP